MLFLYFHSADDFLLFSASVIQRRGYTQPFSVSRTRFHARGFPSAPSPGTVVVGGIPRLDRCIPRLFMLFLFPPRKGKALPLYL